MRNCQRCQTEPKIRVSLEFDREKGGTYQDYQVYCEKCFMAAPVSDSITLAEERWDKIEYGLSIADMEKRILEMGEEWDKENPIAASFLNRGDRT